MQKPLVPLNEPERLADLYQFKILDTLPEEDFNDLVELVADICNCPIASITFIDKDRQWFKAKKNIYDTETPREDSFCAHTILEEKILLIEDTAKDDRFADNPLVTRGLKMGFYAGVPITSSNGYALGSVCAIDNKPRTLSATQINALQRIARQVSRLLDLRMKTNEIIATSEKLVKAEKTIAAFNMKNQEADKLQTAFILHEEIAQAAAAIRLYITHVREAEGVNNPYLEHSVTELEKLRASVTHLSRELSPTTMANDNYSAYIYNAIEEWATQTGGKAKFKKDFIEELQGETGLNVFRLVQDIFRLLQCCQSTTLSLSIREKGCLSIEACYIDSHSNDRELSRIHQANIATRVALLNGTMHNTSEGIAPEGNRLSIKIPLLQ